MLNLLTAPSRGRRRAQADRRVALRLRAATLGLAALVGAAGGVWLATHRNVTLVVDGEVATVATHAATVAELLDRAGVVVGAEDLVEPALDAPVVDGMQVTVIHAREITLLVGDRAHREVVAALTVADALAQLGGGPASELEAGRRDLVRPSRLSRVESGMVVELSDPVEITIVVDGHERTVITEVATLGEVLDRLSVRVRDRDRLTHDLAHQIEHGDVIRIKRVDLRDEPVEEPIPHETREQRTRALAEGERREAQPGEDGLRRIIERVTLVDGVEESRRRVREEIVREPTHRVVEVGTAPPRQPAAAARAAPPPLADDSEPAQAAENVEKGVASWYDNPYGGFTAAHRTLPRGSIVTVTNLANGRSVQVRINDRGPFVDGRVIDLNRAAFAELAPTSRGVVRVRIEW